MVWLTSHEHTSKPHVGPHVGRPTLSNKTLWLISRALSKGGRSKENRAKQHSCVVQREPTKLKQRQTLGSPKGLGCPRSCPSLGPQKRGPLKITHVLTLFLISSTQQKPYVWRCRVDPDPLPAPGRSKSRGRSPGSWAKAAGGSTSRRSDMDFRIHPKWQQKTRTWTVWGLLAKWLVIVALSTMVYRGLRGITSVARAQTIQVEAPPPYKGKLHGEGPALRELHHMLPCLEGRHTGRHVHVGSIVMGSLGVGNWSNQSGHPLLNLVWRNPKTTHRRPKRTETK